MAKRTPSTSPARVKKPWSKPTLVRLGSIGDVAGAAPGQTQLSNFQLVTS